MNIYSFTCHKKIVLHKFSLRPSDHKESHIPLQPKHVAVLALYAISDIRRWNNVQPGRIQGARRQLKHRSS